MWKRGGYAGTAHADQPRQLPKSGRLCRLRPTKVSRANRQLQKVEAMQVTADNKFSLDHSKLQKVEEYAGYRQQLRFRIHDRNNLCINKILHRSSCVVIYCLTHQQPWSIFPGRKINSTISLRNSKPIWHRWRSQTTTMPFSKSTRPQALAI